MSAGMRITLAALAIAIALGAAPRAPAPAGPVAARGVQYEASYQRYLDGGRFAGMRAWVEAFDQQSQRRLWKTLVYEIHYDRYHDIRVQDVHIRSLELEPLGLVVTTERDKTYLVDLNRHTVREWKKSKGR